MILLIRVALQIVLFFLLIGMIVGIASAETGIAEKMVLAVVAALLIWAASLVRRIREPFQRVLPPWPLDPRLRRRPRRCDR